MSRPTPPRWATTLLERTLPGGPAGRSILGDLRQEWHGRRAGVARDLWYGWEVLRLWVRYGPAATGPRVLDDARQAVRSLRRDRVPAAFALMALALGIAAPATMFSLGAGVTRDLDVPGPERLAWVGERAAAGRSVLSTTLPRIRPFLEEHGLLDAAGVFGLSYMDLSGVDGPPERRRGMLVSPGVLEAAGVDAALGRRIAPGDLGPTAPPVVLLGHQVWTVRFGGDRGVLGRTVRVNGEPRTVVGVMPRGFAFPDGAEVWVPMDPDDGDHGDAPAWGLAVRLAPDASLEALQEWVDAVDAGRRSAGLRDAGAGEDDGVRALAAQAWRDRMIPTRARRIIRTMVLLVVLVLLIACADVMNLFLARGLARGRDTAVRAALGAERGRLVRQHLLEVVLLAVAGGAVALGITAAALEVLERALAPMLSWWMVMRIDVEALVFCGGLVVLAAFAAGIVPALRAGRVDVATTLRSGGRGASAAGATLVSRGLVVAQVAFSAALLVVAGLMTRGALHNMRTDGVYATESVLAARYALRGEPYPDETAVTGFHRELLERLAGRPGVEGVALTSHLPGIFSLYASVEVEGEVAQRPEDRPRTHVVRVTPGFFETLEIPLLRGRDLAWSDDGTAAVVNRAFADRWLQGRDPLGVRLRLAGGEGDQPGPWMTVVGLVGPAGLDVGQEDRGDGIYALADGHSRRMAIVMRAGPGRDPLALVPHVREGLRASDPDLPLYELDTLAGLVRRTYSGETVFAALFSLFGLVGLVLTGVGLYGLLAFSIRRRVRELGVRIALGSGPVRLVGRVLRGTGLQVAGGTLAGLALAALVAPMLGDALSGMDPRDPVVYGVVAAVLLASAVAAAVSPVRLAVSVNVVEALSRE